MRFSHPARAIQMHALHRSLDSSKEIRGSGVERSAVLPIQAERYTPGFAGSCSGALRSSSESNSSAFNWPVMLPLVVPASRFASSQYFARIASRVIFGLMGSKDKGKKETKKAPKPKPKVEPGRKRGEDSRLGGPPKL